MRMLKEVGGGSKKAKGIERKKQDTARKEPVVKKKEIATAA